MEQLSISCIRNKIFVYDSLTIFKHFIDEILFNTPLFCNNFVCIKKMLINHLYKKFQNAHLYYWMLFKTDIF